MNDQITTAFDNWAPAHSPESIEARRSLAYRCFKYSALLMLIMSGSFIYSAGIDPAASNEIRRLFQYDLDYSEVSRLSRETDRLNEKIAILLDRVGDGLMEFLNSSRDLNETIEAYLPQITAQDRRPIFSTENDLAAVYSIMGRAVDALVESTDSMTTAFDRELYDSATKIDRDARAVYAGHKALFESLQDTVDSIRDRGKPLSRTVPAQAVLLATVAIASFLAVTGVRQALLCTQMREENEQRKLEAQRLRKSMEVWHHAETVGIDPEKLFTLVDRDRGLTTAERAATAATLPLAASIAEIAKSLGSKP